MAAALGGGPPNPSGAHRSARAAAAVLTDARKRIAVALGTESSKVVLTGGGTEACALGILGVRQPTAVCISAVEHIAVVRSAELAARRAGVDLIELDVDANGVLDLDGALDRVPDGALVAIMAANNETGAVQPIVDVARRLREGREVTIFCDAVAAAPTRQISELIDACDLVAIAGHKLGGPPGAGIVVADRPASLEPLIPGGDQEHGLRAGTQDVAAAVGLAAAIEAAIREIDDGSVAALAARRDRLASAVLEVIPEAAVTSVDADRLVGHLHLTVPGRRSEEILVLLDRHGVAASAGAACASGAPLASRVLLAMGIDEELARSALRLTLATSTSDDDVDRLAEVIPAVLRAAVR